MMSAQSPKVPTKDRPSLLIRLVRCCRGTAAIEFGYIVPIMFFMFLGSVEFSQAVTVDRRVTQVASSTADLVARQKTVTTSDLNGYMAIISQLMRPYDASPLFLTISSVYASASDATVTKVCWSYNRVDGSSTKGYATYTAGSTFSLPTGLVDAGGSVIVVEVRYDYSPVLFSYFITGVKQMEEKFYLKPRLTSQVKLDSIPTCA
ncbi:MAG: TadE/TadG family type IV pilus assembly protein [Pirellulaceae bacterium]|jgi:Flp pilus assembly protein TadG